MSFLMVGHTHEDIDARFSIIANDLRRNKAITLPVLFQRLQTVASDAKQLTTIYNFRDWVKPHLNHIEGHSGPHHYKFVKMGQKVEGMYKGLCTDPWKMMPYSLMSSIPAGGPEVVKPKFDGGYAARLANAITQWGALLTVEEKQWWLSFQQQLTELANNPRAREMYCYCLNTFQELLGSLPRTNTHQARVRLPRELEEMADSETRPREV